MMEARFYKVIEGGVECQLCPHHCHIKEGSRGICRSRECRDGKLLALSYGRPCALADDPVEKKPLYHFMPGTRCLSLSCTGCNLSCRWCQNSDISQVPPEGTDSYRLSPEEVVEIALKHRLPSIAYTYTEPFTWWEYMYDIAALAHENGLKNIFNIRIYPTAAATAANSLQSCLTLCDPIDGSPPGSPVSGILQARTLEWVAISFSNA